MIGFCRRPSTMRDQPVESDDDVFKRDYDIPTMASNINHEVFRYDMFDHEDGDEVNEPIVSVYCWMMYALFIYLFTSAGC